MKIENITCKKCGSIKIISSAKIIDYSHSNIKRNLVVEIAKPKEGLFKKSESTELLANICGNCGNVELQILDYKKLWEAFIG